jgi:hypothetical protein
MTLSWQNWHCFVYAKDKEQCVKFDDVTAVTMKTNAFWDDAMYSSRHLPMLSNKHITGNMPGQHTTDAVLR